MKPLNENNDAVNCNVLDINHQYYITRWHGR